MSVNTLLNCCTATALFAMQGKKVGFLSVYIVSFFPYNGLSAHFFSLVPPGLFSFTSSFTFVLFFFSSYLCSTLAALRIEVTHNPYFIHRFVPFLHP